MFEGGVRVPCIIRWPARIPSGKKSSEFLTALEVFPTICNAAGVLIPKSLKLDGFDMLTVLQGKSKSLRSEMFWQRRNDKVLGWNTGNGWKAREVMVCLIFEMTLQKKNDLSQELPNILRKIRHRFNNWKTEMAAAEPRGPFRDY